jgi:hypothetical protein
MSAATHEQPEAPGIDAGVLAKVRALLAKAESTSFPAEAEALTAKAHELMARYSIEHAVLDSAEAAVGVHKRTITIAAPYAKARFHLFGQIARACNCRALWQPGPGVATIFGFPADLDATEVLYTSLLLQATAAMTASSPRGGSPSRTAAFRRAFLYAFSARIGQRLEAARQAAVDDAARSHGPELLPVLASRDEAVEAALADAFPNARPMSVSFSNARGYRAGIDAADRATLATQGSFDGRPGIGRAGG